MSFFIVSQYIIYLHILTPFNIMRALQDNNKIHSNLLLLKSKRQNHLNLPSLQPQEPKANHNLDKIADYIA